MHRAQIIGVGRHSSTSNQSFLVDRLHSPKSGKTNVIFINGNCNTLHILDSADLTVVIQGRIIGGIVLWKSYNVTIHSYQVFNLQMEYCSDIRLFTGVTKALFAVYNCVDVQVNRQILPTVSAFRRCLVSFDPTLRVRAL